MSSRHPKRLCLSQTASDYRFACTVSQKNLGQGYTQEILKKISLFPGKHHLRFVSRVQKIAWKRREMMRSTKFKKCRMELKKLRSALRNQRENSEGITDATSCTLLSEPAIDHNLNIEWKIQENDDNNDTIHIVLLDLETNGFSEEILQIAAKCQDNNFSIYVHPVSEIAATTTVINGLSSNYGDLMYHGKKSILSTIKSRPRRTTFMAKIVGEEIMHSYS